MKDDAALLHALQKGDPAALASLFETYADRVYRLALGLLQDPLHAEDVVQDTFLAAISNLERFEGRSSLGTWLYRVAYNASMDRLRRQREDLPLDEDPDTDEGEIPLPEVLIDWEMTPEELLADDETRAYLDQAISELPESLRAVFILRDIEELSTAETAEALGISVGAAKVRLHRARLTLRELLSEYFRERFSTEGERR